MTARGMKLVDCFPVSNFANIALPEAVVTAAPQLSANAKRYGLLVTGLAPAIPQVLGSIFNIWYNAVVIAPLLVSDPLRRRFALTVIFYNAVVYPLAIAFWLRIIFSARPVFHALVHQQEVAQDRLEQARRRIINLPWIGAGISSVAWLGCIPVFIPALLAAGQPIHSQLLWHLPISFVISAFIAVTQTFFLIELASHWALFPVFFSDTRPDRIAGSHPPSLRTRGLMWAISAGVCPIASLLLLMFAPRSSSAHLQWFAVFVGAVGIGFGLCSAILMTHLVAKPVDELRAAFNSVGAGKLDIHLPLRRADEFGALVADFNSMVVELREKEHVRRAFGLHVGEKVAQEILSRDPELGGTEQIITVMFLDIRGFTARTSGAEPRSVINFLNRFLQAMVEIIENEHGGVVNKFLGDGLMAIFGLSAGSTTHADDSVQAARSMLRRLEKLNTELTAAGELPLQIGIGINTGRAIVGSIGSFERMEFTVIGDTVNIASRIEALNKTSGTNVLLSKMTRDALANVSNLRLLPPQRIKGVEEMVETFTFDRSSGEQK
jgi:adenylate cyclase